VAPRMTFGARLGMRTQKVMQHMEQGEAMRPVSACPCVANIVDDHVTNPLQTMLLVGEVGGKRRRGDLGQVLMLSDGQHLLPRRQPSRNLRV
jgi:hypothetical protein